jgi:hypothetical protein
MPEPRRAIEKARRAAGWIGRRARQEPVAAWLAALWTLVIEDDDKAQWVHLLVDRVELFDVAR